MPLQATSGAASYDAFGGGVAAVPNYIEDVFSTYLYTGNGSTQTINNGIDLAGKGGLVWAKSRSGAAQHVLADTARGTGQILQTSTTNGNTATALNITSFNADGYGLSSYSGSNGSGITYASWTFRKQPKFFDVVTYTGDGSSNRPVAHSLASVPGCIIIKSTGTVTNWMVWHRSLPTDNLLTLNSTAVQANYATVTIHDVTSTNFQVDNYSMLNASGVQYVAYVYAHNAGGFGLTGTDNVISCGSFTCPSSGGVDVNLGYEPQWILTKKVSGAENWNTWDTMRGWALTNQAFLAPNNSNAEVTFSGTEYFYPTATGFRLNSSFGLIGDYIYIAIRRGPMKVPTDGTKVFSPNLVSNTSAYSVGFPPDMSFAVQRSGAYNRNWGDRLRGSSAILASSLTAAESSYANAWGWNQPTNSFSSAIVDASDYVIESFRRAPGFFDEVCYTGTGVARTVAHNLAAVPELMIVKNRSIATNWPVYSSALGATQFVYLNLTDAKDALTSMWNNTAPTSSVFTTGTTGATNRNGDNMVAYLFATCPGVSKVGGYTGTGTTQTINCGFTTGARFVLIKRTDSTGDWYVWDSARGIVSGNDPYLLLNSTAAEVTSTDYVDTYSAGFEISSTAPAAINASGGSFIFLAIA